MEKKKKNEYKRIFLSLNLKACELVELKILWNTQPISESHNKVINLK